jgi:hypothetical protein
LFEGGLRVGTGGEGNNLKSVGIRFGHAESAPANRAGGTQDGNMSHVESLSYAAVEGGASYPMVP